MKANKPFLMAILGIGSLAGLLFLLTQHPAESTPVEPSRSTSASEASSVANIEHLEKPRTSLGPSVEVVSEGVDVDALLSSETRLLPDHIERITESQLEELISHIKALPARPEWIEEITGMLRILCLARREEATDLIVVATTKEFAGQELTPSQHANLGYTLYWLGLVAKDDSRALKFLIQGCSVSFWEQQQLWTVNDRTPTRWLAATCLNGLVISQHREAEQKLRDIWENREAWQQSIDKSGVADAAWRLSVVQKAGIEEALRVFADPQMRDQSFDSWKHSAGSNWCSWAAPSSIDR